MLVPAGGGSECGALIIIIIFKNEFPCGYRCDDDERAYLSFFFFLLHFRSAEISFTVSPAFGNAAAASVTSWAPPMIVAGRKS